MQFINETLLPGEKLAFETRPHWIVFGPAVAAWIVALWFWLRGVFLVPFNFMLPMLHISFIEGVQYVLFLVALYQLGQALITYFASEYGVTDQRVIMKEGWIYRNSLEIFWDKIEAIHVTQGVIGRILNYGTITIVGTGGSQDMFFYIPDPLNFRKRVQEEVEKQEERRV